MFTEELTYPGGTRVLVWRIDEDAPQLLDLCRQAGVSVEDLSGRPVKRQREKAAERLLLQLAFDKAVILTHTSQGAPLVEDDRVKVSITHTPRLVALACDDDRIIGLDAEACDRGQVLRVRGKFLNASEMAFIQPDDLPAHIIAWTAKEAIIKAERNSALDWTGGIVLEPFEVQSVAEELTFMAQCGARRYRLWTRLVEGHFLTLAVLAACQTGAPGQ